MIKYENYTIEHEPNAIGRVNVYKISVIKDEKSKNYGKETSTVIAYGITLTRAVEIIAQDVAMKVPAYMETVEYVKHYMFVVNATIKGMAEPYEQMVKDLIKENKKLKEEVKSLKYKNGSKD